MPSQKKTSYVGTVIRILLGLVPIAIGVFFLIERDDWVPGKDKFLRYGIMVTVGMTLFVSGVLGVVKRRRQSERKSVWYVATLLLALPIAAMIVLGARAYNIWNAESSLFASAQQAQSPEAWDEYDLFVMHHHLELARSRVNPAAQQRVEASRDLGLGDDAWERMHGRVQRLDSWEDSLSRMRMQDLGPWLDALTPVREHLGVADAQYRETRFIQAMSAGSIRALRIHRAEFPNGPHWNETAEALRQHYRQAEERYAATTANGQGRPEGVAGLRALLQHLRDNDVDQTEVPVAFLPVAGLDARAFEAALAEALGGASILPVEPAFTAELNHRRQGSITRRIGAALQTVVGDLFTVVDATLEESRTSPRFLMEYTVRPAGSVYTFEDQEALPVSQRQLLVGIAMQFDATVQVPDDQPLPDRHVGFHFALEGAPAERISAGSADASSEERAAFAYGAMAQSAFNDFEQKLVEAYGFDSER